MRSLRKCDIVAGAFIALLGAVVIIAASQIRGDVEERLPPRTLPYAVGFMTLAGGLGLASRTGSAARPRRSSGRRRTAGSGSA